jgi:predicted GH43/DUF377 family glycosyl hydrolase
VGNPIICPDPKHEWESFTTFNPTALEIDGVTHILYRAQGHDYVSRIGHATSANGVTIDSRDEIPAFQDAALTTNTQFAVDYGSGGSVGGAEDPRATLLDGIVYMFFVAYDGASPPRLALTTISKDAFLGRRWNEWSSTKTVSPPGVVDKSGTLFPEKIKGKFVVMHRIFPDIQLDYRDDLDFSSSGDYLQTLARIPASESGWDSRKIGAGAPPIKTAAGWILIYYGVDDADAREYKVGAMLLDLEDPARVLFRCSSPILEPRAWYEQSGFKAGILYPCGAVVKGPDLLVYYGAADNFVAVAKVNLAVFLAGMTGPGGNS